MLSNFPNKNSSTEQRAKNVNDAIDAALKELGVGMDDVNIEVIDEGAKGFLGIGARDAVVKVTVKETETPAPARTQARPAKTEAKPVKTEAKPVKTEPKAAKAEIKKEEAPTPSSRTAADDSALEAAAEKFLKDIFDAMKLEVSVSAKMAEDNTLNVNLEGGSMGIVIGKRGDTLDSLQYLTSLVVNHESDDYIKVSIDTENYREKRTEALLALSNRLADKVAKNGKRFTLEPMNPYERRVIHANLQDDERVTTYSIGSEPYRKVVIAPKDAKPYRKNNRRRNNNQRRRVNDAPKEAPKPTTPPPTYKADFKPQQHKAEYKSFEDYFAHENNE